MKNQSGLTCHNARGVKCSCWIVAIFSLAISCNTAMAQVVNDPELNDFKQSTKDFFDLYENQLQSVLKTRLQEEEDFVAAVIDMVRADKIPKPVVDRAWLWVRNNRVASRYPFVYFERVLRLEAEKLKIEIPDFDRSIYSTARRNTVTRQRR